MILNLDQWFRMRSRLKFVGVFPSIVALVVNLFSELESFYVILVDSIKGNNNVNYLKLCL